MATKRIDVVSDTHGRLSSELLKELDGCDLIVHAGDITSQDDLITLRALAPVKACLGNNDWSGEYGPEVTKLVRFDYEGLSFSVSHYRERLTDERCDVAVCGHTHVPVIERHRDGSLLINPGSPTFPRSEKGPTMARLTIADGKVLTADIVQLGAQEDDAYRWSFFRR